MTFSWKRWLKSFGGRKSGTVRRERNRKSSLRLEGLEDRTVLTTTLYIDFGDAYPGGVLNDTIENFEDVVQGPRLEDGDDPIPDDHHFIIQSFSDSMAGVTYPNGISQLRSDIVTLVARAYEPFDITVVDLTATPQFVNGHMVQAATSLADAAATLAINDGDAEHNDAYIFFGAMRINLRNNSATVLDSDYDPSSDYGGLAVTKDIGNLNENDGSAWATAGYSDSYNPLTDLYQLVAHEAGHTFGLVHTARDSSNVERMPYSSEFMSYDDDDNSVLMMFRYPTAADRSGEGTNGDEDNTTNDTLSTLVDDDRDNQTDPLVRKTIYDQLALDPYIGPSNIEYITGTGAFDQITLVRTSATTAHVTIEAFADAAFTQPIPVPGLAVDTHPNSATVYEYDIDTTKAIIIEAGGGGDRISIDARIGANITVRGMANRASLGSDYAMYKKFDYEPQTNNDQLVVNGFGLDAEYTPAGTMEPGFDFNDDYQGWLDVGPTTILFEEFLSTGSIRLENVASATLLSPLGNDDLTLINDGAGYVRVRGTVNGSTSIVPLLVSTTTSLTIDVGNNDVGANNNTLVVDTFTGNPIPALGATLRGGVGTDRIEATADANFDLGNSSLTVYGYGTVTLQSVEDSFLTGGDGDNSFTLTGWTHHVAIDGRDGADTVAASKDKDFTLTNSTLTATDGLNANLIDIEQALLVGGAGANTFTVSGWTRSGAIAGLGGSDTIIASKDVNFTLSNTSLSLSGGLNLTLASDFEVANLTGGASANTFDVSGWTGGGTLAGGGDTDTVLGTKDANFTLANGSLSASDGLSMTLNSIDVALLTGGGAANNFTVSGWTGNGTLNGAGGTDTVTAIKNQNFTLGNIFLSTSDSMSLSLANIERADLTGGALGSTFDVSGWGKGGSLTGGGGVATVRAAKDGDFALTNTQITATDGLSMSLSAVPLARLTGGSSANTFVLSNWTGFATLDGAGSGDTYTINFNGAGTNTTTINDTGTTGADTATVNGTSADNDFVLTATSLVLGGERVNHDGLENLNVNGLGGVDTFDVTASATTAVNIAGGNPVPPTHPGDFLLYRGTGVADLTFNGPGSGRISQTGLQPVTYTGIEECVKFIGVTVNVSFDAGADAGDGTPDVITIRRHDDDLQVFINSTDEEAGCLDFDSVGTVTINGSSDDDTLNLDNSGGYLNRGFVFNAAGGTNTLDVYGDPGLTIARETHIYDSATQGTIYFDADDSGGPGAAGALGTDVELITYFGVATINDVKPVSRLDLYLRPNTASTASLTNGASFQLFVTAQLSGDGATTNFANKPVASISGRSLADSITVNNPAGANALTALELYGYFQPGDPGATVDDGAVDTFTFIASDVPVLAYGQDGADVFNVRGNTEVLNLFGGAGDDAFNVSSDAPAHAGNLAGIAAVVNIDAGTGAENTLTVSNFGGAATPTAVITDHDITAFAPSAINYSATGGSFTAAGGSGIVIRGSNTGDDGFNVRSTLAGSTTRVEGNGGADVIVVASSAPALTGKLDGIAGNLTLDGGAGDDTLDLSDSSSTTANANVVVAVDQITGLAGPTDAAVVAYSSFKTLSVSGSDTRGDKVTVLSPGAIFTLNTLGGADFVNVRSLTEDAAVNLGSGNDRAVVANAANSLAGIQAPLLLAGGGEVDELSMTDLGAANAQTYALTATTLDRSGASTITYFQFSAVTLLGGSAANTYGITGTGGTAINLVQDGTGSSTFTIQGDGLLGANTFRGEGGDDAFTLNAGVGFTSQAVVVVGGTGRDSLAVNGRVDGDDMAFHFFADAGSGNLVGLGTRLDFQTVEDASIDGQGGLNSLAWVDDSGRGFGSAIAPETGVIVRPTGAASGDVRVGLASPVAPVLTFTNVNGDFTVNGNGKGAGTRDTVTVLAASTDGLQSEFGEITSADGVDRIGVADQLVTINNKTLGTLRSVGIAVVGGQATVANLIVRGGSEPRPFGDDVTADPSKRLNILLDGMDPTSGRPGDHLTVTTEGSRTIAKSRDASAGPDHARIVQDSDGASVGFIHFEVIAGTNVAVTATGPGDFDVVNVLDASSKRPRYGSFNPFVGFTGGVTVSSADVNGDGIADVVVAAGNGGAPAIMVFDGIDGALVASFYAYDSQFRGGVFVATGDVNGDGYADIIAGAGIGGGPHVKIISGKDLSVLASFFAYSPDFRNGVQVASGDTNGDGFWDIITGAGPNSGPHVKQFDGKTFAEVMSYFAFDSRTLGGITIAAADLNGDYLADVVVGTGIGDEPMVRAFAARTTSMLADFRVNDPFAPGAVSDIPNESGLRVGATDMDGDGIADIIVAKGPGTRPLLRGYKIATLTNADTRAVSIGLAEAFRELVFAADFPWGVYVGGND